MREAVRALAALVIMLGAAHPAAARSDKTLGYARAQLWPAAVRFLVIDERVKLIEKDADAGYVTFEVKDDGKLYRGSLELVALSRDGQDAVRVIVQIDDRPSWVELAMLLRLERRVRAELGPPPPAKPPAKPDEPKPDSPPRAGDSPPSANPDETRPEDRGPPVSPTP